MRDDDVVCTRCGRNLSSASSLEDRPTITPVDRAERTRRAGRTTRRRPVGDRTGRRVGSGSARRTRPAAGGTVDTAGPDRSIGAGRRAVDTARPDRSWCGRTVDAAGTGSARDRTDHGGAVATSRSVASRADLVRASGHAPGAAWRRVATGRTRLGTSRPAVTTAPGAPWPPAAGQWPAAHPVVGADPRRDPNPDKANSIVLVVISAIVIAGIVALAFLAQNGIGPTRSELQLDRPLTEHVPPDTIDQPGEVTGGR